MVDWLLRWSFVATRGDAVSLSEDLIRLAHVQQLSAINEKEPSKGKFIDSNEEFYRFVSYPNSSKGLYCKMYYLYALAH